MQKPNSYALVQIASSQIKVNFNSFVKCKILVLFDNIIVQSNDLHCVVY